jgi:hypothetical protein
MSVNWIEFLFSLDVIARIESLTRKPEDILVTNMVKVKHNDENDDMPNQIYAPALDQPVQEEKYVLDIE